jgi:uncharacterized delta-60 repeat protein
MKNILYILLTFLFAQILIFHKDSNAQVVQDWIQTFNGTGNGEDVANAMTVDTDGNIYITGYSTVSGNIQRFTTIRYNSSGVKLWEAIYNGPGSFQYGDEGLDIEVDDSGNVYVTGSSAAGSTEYTLDYVTIKYNPSGVEEWAERYSSPGNDQDIAFALALDNSGNVYVTGQSGHPALNSNIATIKYNSSGAVQWIAEFDGTGNWDTGNDLIVDEAGNVYVTGFFSVDWGTAYLNFITIKYDSQGNQQWAHGYNGTGGNSDEAVAICLDKSGNIYVTGFSTGTVYDIATIKYNSAGDQQWLQIYSSSSPSIDVPIDMVVDESGNVYITGAISLNIGTLKYNTDGVLQWNKIYNYNGNFDAGNSIALDVVGDVYVTGVSQSGTFESTSDYATIKYNLSGDEIWVQRYNGSANNWDAGNSIALDNAGNVYVTGFSTTNTNYDFGTIKYSQPPIPVELTSFTANIANDADIILNWSTAIEMNNHQFEVERRTENSEYYTIGYVEGSGTTSEPKEYSFIDDKVEVGKYFYRLKQTDFDGSYKYSDEIEIEVPGTITFSLEQNYPNPFNPTTTIKYSVPSGIANGVKQSQIVTLIIYDILGNEVITLVNEAMTAGNYAVEFSAEGLTSGIYFYTLKSGNLTQTKKLILLK